MTDTVSPEPQDPTTGEPRRRLWVVNPMPSENVTFAQVIWESPTAADLLESAKDLRYSIRGPYVLEADDA